MIKHIDQYPVQRVLPTSQHIMWIFDGAWSLIDNFAETPVVVDIGRGERAYPTSEHALAAAKARTKAAHDKIAGSSWPGAAKALGRRTKLRADWRDVKADVMWRVLLAKFAQNPEATEVLMATGDRPIYEGNVWEDQVWGVTEERHGKKRSGVWVGQNILGEMLMEIREIGR
jgi:ribA/ribD-fused uncharacterized protein